MSGASLLPGTGVGDGERASRPFGEEGGRSGGREDTERRAGGCRAGAGRLTLLPPLPPPLAKPLLKDDACGRGLGLPSHDGDSDEGQCMGRLRRPTCPRAQSARCPWGGRRLRPPGALRQVACLQRGLSQLLEAAAATLQFDQGVVEIIISTIMI